MGVAQPPAPVGSTMSMEQAFIEGVKEIVRTALMAIVPLVIVDVQQNTFDWRALGVAALIAVLSGVDKYLHKLETGLGGNGLTVI